MSHVSRQSHAVWQDWLLQLSLRLTDACCLRSKRKTLMKKMRCLRIDRLTRLLPASLERKENLTSRQTY
ncbi:hypothetical protein PMIN04_013040 [Paraphaeosphaeria minitans]